MKLADKTITVTFDEETGAFTYDGLSSLRVGPRRFDAVSVPAKCTQTLHFVPDPTQEGWSFVSISFLGADGKLSWRTINGGSKVIMNNGTHHVEVAVEESAIQVTDANINETAEAVGIRFQITIEIGGNLYTSRDPQIINEKDGSGGAGTSARRNDHAG